MLLILIIFGALFAFPFLFAKKCDGQLKQVPWSVTWLPMWIIDAVLLISGILLFTMDTKGKKGGKKNKEGEDHDNKTDDQKDAYDEDEEEDDDSHGVTITIPEKILSFGTTACFVLAQIFVFAKLDGGLKGWGWFRVFIPWFCYEVLSIVGVIPGAVKSIPESSPKIP